MYVTTDSEHITPSNIVVKSPLLEALKYKPNQEKILYSGGSYGTYLGLAFAAMFPDRIHRFRVDGLVDADDYRKVLWTSNLRDTEKELHQFYYHWPHQLYHWAHQFHHWANQLHHNWSHQFHHWSHQPICSP